jgi:Pyridoxamine 5'-phosphate oxidase
MGGGKKRTKQMTREQALRKLASVPYGRVVYTHHALPAVRAASHLLTDQGQLIIRSHDGAAIVSVTGDGFGTVIAYEADHLGPSARATWYVVVTGLAHRIDDPELKTRYRRMLPRWADGDPSDLICLDAQLLTGYQTAAGSLAPAT